MPNPQQPPTLLTHDWSMGYPMTLRSVRLARLQARRRLTMWSWAGDIDDAVLVVSELVANAVRHGRVIGHELWLRLAESEGGGLVVEVSDPVRAFPEVREAGGEGEGGRGLLVVRGLAHELDWFLRADVGKTVRARLSAPRVPRAGIPKRAPS
ncbi:ATP-binding protein [Streptomyces sp. NBC_01136]|uniref:ATP-binding protein n=1 Tax=unclassified Streptomyces TaxID=2593676 RepID=UPI00324FA358|nr:ATP-binding protein [Streptomyces sp. NBC_01136]